MKPNHRAPPAGAPATPAVGFDGAAIFDAPHNTLTHDALVHDPQALHMAVPRGHNALSPSIPPGPMPQTPKHMRDHATLSLQSIQGLRGLHSARSVPDFHDLYDVPGLDISTAPGDPFFYDYDFQDPLSPTFYEMPLNSSQTLVLTSELSSVGSAASGSSSFLGAPPPPVEGLGIAEPGWTQLSPRSRVQQNQARVTKKTSKQTLRQKRSRANLDQAANERPNGTSNGGTVNNGPASGNASTIGSANGNSNANGADVNTNVNGNGNGNANALASANGNANGNGRPSSPAPSTSTSSSAALSPPFPTSPRSPTRASATRIVSGSALPSQPQMRPMPNVRHMPSTPFPTRGKAAASPAMQSPMRPALSRPAPAAPRLQAAAAATALYTPAAPPPDASRRTSMAAAAAAAAASATQSTPGSRTPRFSPSTIIASSSTRGPQQAQGAASPTPAARMHSSSKLVSAASDSSPAKGMFSQAQAPMPLSALPKPVQTARKVPSNQSMRRAQARKAPNVIPEMSSAMNQFQVELKPQPPRKVPSLPSARPGLEFDMMRGQGEPGHLGPIKKPMPLPGYPARSHSVGPPPQFASHQAPLMDMNQMYFDAPSHEPWLFAGQQQQQQPPPPLPPAPQQSAGGDHHRLSMTSTPRPAAIQHPHMHAAGPPPIPQEPAAPRAPQFTQMRPKTVVPVSNEPSRVHPQGEPPQHVWVAHPPPPKTTRRRTPRQASKQTSMRLSEPSSSQEANSSLPQASTPTSVSPAPSSHANVGVLDHSHEPTPPVPIPSHTAPPPPQPQLMVRPTAAHNSMNNSSGAPASMAPPSMAHTSMPDGSIPSNVAHSSVVDPTMMHAGMAMHPDIFSRPAGEPLNAQASQELSMRGGQHQQASHFNQEGDHSQETRPQEPHPLNELNDGLPSDNEFGFVESMNYSNQEFLDTLEWVPNELDAQWDFMDVLEQDL